MPTITVCDGCGQHIYGPINTVTSVRTVKDTKESEMTWQLCDRCAVRMARTIDEMKGRSIWGYEKRLGNVR